MTDLSAGPTVELLQALIRNACVNDGTPESGGEIRSATLLQSFLEGSGLATQLYECAPGRTSLVARIEGTDPSAPTLCLMGHTDVVPVNEDGWSRDPFSGDIVDGELWGRGAIDMLNVTASMAVAFRDIARTAFRPRGSIVYFAVADEEGGGGLGAQWMTEQHWDAVGCEFLVSEMGGWSALGADGVRRIVVSTGEKGLAWRRLRVHGTPSHGSMPYGADNALIKAAEVIRRLSDFRPAPRIDEIWRHRVAAMDVDDELKQGLLDPARVYSTIEHLPTIVGRDCHASTHTTFSPNLITGGQKTNTIPDVVDIDVDIRTLPGDTPEDVAEFLRAALGDLYEQVDIAPLQQAAATASPIDTRLWDGLAAGARVAHPGAELIPGLWVGGTDARFFRERGTVAYGAGVLSAGVDFSMFAERFHGNDERIDVASLGLATQFWRDVIRDVSE